MAQGSISIGGSCVGSIISTGSNNVVNGPNTMEQSDKEARDLNEAGDMESYVNGLNPHQFRRLFLLVDARIQRETVAPRG